MHGQRRGGRTAEPRTPTGKREPDQNRERLIYCISSLVGHRVTVKLRNNVIYEGLFHSCSLESDYSITLKLARRLPSQDNLVSGEVVNTLVIPGKDFLQVSAVDVPAPCELEDESSPLQAGAFTTDADIAARRTGQVGQERDLVPWNHDGDDPTLGGLEESRGGEAWDQFARNEKLYGVMSTYHDDLYTTKLDPSAIPRAAREQADRIAAEIEREQQSAEVEKNVDCDGEEEDLWSAVQNPPRRKDQMLTGSSTAASSQRGSRARNSQDQNAMVPQVPLTKEFLSQHDSLQIPAEGFAKEHRAKRSLITAHSPMRSPMVSEMKRINALNLEPALPKLDDKTRNDWINYKQSQTRTNSKPVQGACLKTEFQQSLEVFHKWEAAKHSWPPPDAQGANDHGEGMAPRTSQSGQVVPAEGQTGQAGNSQPATAPASTGGDASNKATRSDSKPFAFNADSKPFTFNAGAATFTPSGMGTSSQPITPINNPLNDSAAQAPPIRKSPSAPSTPFTPQGNPEVVKKTLDQLLNPFLGKATGQKPESSTPAWPQATGPPYKEVLGTASGATQPMQNAGMMPGVAGAMPSGQWQPAQGQMVGNAQMASMPQGFVVPAQQSQMYAQMYPGGPRPSQQSGQGGQGTPGGPQQSGGSQSQGQPGQHMVYQMGQMPMMPGGMVSAQGQHPGGCMGAMGAQAKFGGQPPTMVVPMAMPAGNYGPGFAAQGGGACVQPGVMQPQMYRPPMPGGQSNMGGGQMSDQMNGHG
mmetsp:Transcript_10502/g.23901  ORF Transcript_10502/g.23901 Transcript_10502/m.23901 type:complete len:754 (+) Transcript_10502:115-2376(+)